MYHWLMISILVRGTIHLRTGILWLDLLVQFIVETPLIILICAVPFAFLERPFMRRDWPTRFKQFVLGTKAPVPAQADSAVSE
jgi:peptidoglycan/LPS O-acetylase OafA/YrhL